MCIALIVTAVMFPKLLGELNQHGSVYMSSHAKSPTCYKARPSAVSSAHSSIKLCFSELHFVHPSMCFADNNVTCALDEV